MNIPQIMKPYEVRVIALISALIGVLSLYLGWEPLRLLFSLRNMVDFPTWYISDVLLTIGVGVLLLVTAGLVFRYKKLGLQLGLVAHVLYAGYKLQYVARGGQLDALGWLTVALSLVALYFMYRHLTHDPERLAFS